MEQSFPTDLPGPKEIRPPAATALAYKPHLPETIARLRQLYDHQAGDRIFARFRIPTRALKRFAKRYGEGFCDYPSVSERISFWDEHLAERSALEDDSVPVAYLSEMDQGLYGGMLGGEAQFLSDPATGWISSMVKPLLTDWSELDRLHFDPRHFWWQRYLCQLDRYVEAAGGKFCVSHFILIDGLNFVFELVGATGTYLALDERPNDVRRAIDLAFDINVRVQEEFFARVPLLAGGTASNMAGWLPGGRIVSESVDPFHMTSVDYFERWGREPVERMLSHFDGGVFHIHGNGRHLLEAVCSLSGLKAIFMGDDRPYPAAFDIRHELRTRAGDVPLIVQVEYESFRAALAERTLPDGMLYVVAGAPDIATANRLMDEVRAYRTH
ncbi:MAG: hypothetical protein RBS80_20385 [Thermoguttaceae bacterium]|jgi:hypothetical protein|nr:hypothetical protein [Thermoguttaceae bacterium]